jgi:hypothetical protein
VSVAPDVEDRGDAGVTVPYGEYRPVEVDEELVVAIDAFGCEPGCDTAAERLRRERRDFARDALREPLGCGVPGSSGHADA